jgi:RNA polymerase-binding transcription factor DksA
MTKEKLNRLKEKLETEKSLLEKGLPSVGRINPDNPADWEARPAEMDTLKADDNEVADTIEEFESNAAVLKQLETRYNNVKDALARMESGTYGVCRVCGKEIEEDRLNANPAADTCKKHMS